MFGASITLGAVDNATPIILGLEKSLQKLGDAAKNEAGQKLKNFISLAAFEEATRRTGEWSQEIQRTAQALGITAEKLQTLNILAGQSNVAEDKVTSMLDELDAKRREAIAGNTDLIYSFKALGVTFDDLQHMNKGDLFGKLISNQGIGNIVAGTGMGNALEALTGVGSIPTVQALATTANGKDLNGLNEQAKGAGEVVNNEDVAAMSDEWIQIKQDLADALKELTPIGKLLLGFATILSELILGLSHEVRNIFDLITGILTGNTDLIKSSAKAMGNTLLNAVFGIVKIVTGLLDLVAGAFNSWIRKIPGLKNLVGDYKSTGGMTGLVQEAQDAINKRTGATRTDIRGGEGLGNALAIVGTGGTGAVARGGANALLDFAGMAEKAGASGIATRALNTAVKLDKWGSESGLVGRLMRREKPTTVEGELKAMQQDALAGLIGNTLATVGAIATKGAIGKNKVSKDAPFNGILTQQGPTVFNGESNGNLKIGGIFGSGFQARIIKLNEQMLQQLAAIARNTAYNPYTQTRVNPNTTPSGGM